MQFRIIPTMTPRVHSFSLVKNMFKTERIYSATNQATGLLSWYFITREGREGPFASEADACRKLHQFVCQCIDDPQRIPRTRFIRAIQP